MSNDKKDQSIVDRVWNFFSSITLAIIVFFVISLTSIVGTIIEQEAEPQQNIKLLAKFFGNSAPDVYRVLDALGFTNMYHAWWFISLLFIFAANLIICSLDRLPKIWKLVKDPIAPLKPAQFNSFPISREVSFKGNVGDARAAVESAMKNIGFKSDVFQGESVLQIYAEKHRYGRLGVYVTHFSILLILIGAVVGIFFGFNASLNLLEGTSSAVAYKKAGAIIPLGFEIRCIDFDVSFYENSDAPKGYKSWLAIMENGIPVKINGKEITEIDVNSPLSYKGITFYQANYGFSPNRDSIFRFSLTSNAGKSEAAELKFGDSFVIPGTNVSGKIAGFSPALGQDPSGNLYTYAEMMNNPAVFVEFMENGKLKYKQWIMKRYPQTWRVPDGVVEFKDLWGAQFTGLQVRKDPGVWIVYLGSMIMAVGLYAAFFMSHARIWVGLSSDGSKGVKVAVAASINKNKAALEQKIDKLIKAIVK